MKASLLTRYRNVSADGSGLEFVVWRVPVPPGEHPYKYRLVYLENGQRVVGFDNERGKGDHKHVGDGESVYAFVTVDRLLEDFFPEVEPWKTRNIR